MIWTVAEVSPQALDPWIVNILLTVTYKIESSDNEDTEGVP